MEPAGRRGLRLVVALLLATVSAPASAHNSAPPDGPRTLATDDAPACSPAGEAVVLEGTIAPEEESTYRLLPVEVAVGTTRVEVHYTYGDAQPSPVPNSGTVVDLGLWDEDGTEGPAAFRGWGGSHHGVSHKGLPPIWVQADSAHRGFGAGAVEPGTWHVELGFGNVASGGGTYRVEVTCLAPEVGPEPAPDPVDPDHVARAEPGWYHGDFHMHAWDSSPAGPTNHEVVAAAREHGLDFLPITEYVTTWHHETWGTAARANPDLVIWPGREIITYDGHGIVLGETPNVVDYRVGFRGITMRELQAASLADGAEFGIPHPTIFPGPTGDFCRGCEAEYLDDIDLDRVLTIEVLTGPVEYDASYLGGPAGGPGIEFPFMQSAIDLWEDLLLDGHRMTAVSGSDAKDAAGHGVNATAVYAEELSRPALVEGLARMRAYVRTRGVADSPELEFTGRAGDEEVMIGGSLAADQAELTITLRGAQGHTIELVRNGLPVAFLPVPTDDFATTVPATRGSDGGPLGTFYRLDVRDPEGIRSIVANPIFLTAPAADDAPPEDRPPEDRPPEDRPPGDDGDRPGGPGGPGGPPRPMPATGGGLALVGIGVLLAGAAARRT